MLRWGTACSRCERCLRHIFNWLGLLVHSANVKHEYTFSLFSVCSNDVPAYYANMCAVILFIYFRYFSEFHIMTRVKITKTGFLFMSAVTPSQLLSVALWLPFKEMKGKDAPPSCATGLLGFSCFSWLMLVNKPLHANCYLTWCPIKPAAAPSNINTSTHGFKTVCQLCVFLKKTPYLFGLFNDCVRVLSHPGQGSSKCFIIGERMKSSQWTPRTTKKRRRRRHQTKFIHLLEGVVPHHPSLQTPSLHPATTVTLTDCYS